MGEIEGSMVFGFMRFSWFYELLYMHKEHGWNRGKYGFFVFGVFMIL